MSKTTRQLSKHPTRERILGAAKALFQQRGYFAVGTAEILARARAPKGSMYHHFAHGKQQIAIAAIDEIRNEVLATTRKLATEQHSVAEVVRLLAKGMAGWLRRSNWREGTLLASLAIGAVPDLPKLHRALKSALDAWREQLMTLLIREGRTRAAARNLSNAIVSSLEGAMLLARIDRDEHVVIDAAETLVSLLKAKR